MPLYGPDGKPIVIRQRFVGEKPIGPSRQMKRAYLRVVAMTVINQVAGLEPRKIRRAMALARAKRPAFIEEVRSATQAW